MSSGTTVAPPRSDSQQRRATRLDARYSLWVLSSLRRVRACGRFPSSSEMGVAVKASGTVIDGNRRSGLGGVQSCGSVWACPMCAERIQAERQAQVGAALAAARLRGWEVLFATFTMRHESRHKLPSLWDHLTAAWSAMTNRAGGSACARPWKQDKADYGIAGYLRLVEVTHGVNGWHVHVHCLLFIDPARAGVAQLLAGAGDTAGSLSDRQVQELGARMFGRWRDALDVDGIRPSQRHGVDIRRVRGDELIADYFAKQVYDRKGESSTAHDVTGAHGKDAKNGNRTPFGILRSLVNHATGEVGLNYDHDLELWHTYERASKGRRQLLWSRGLKLELALEEDKTDQEIVDEDAGGEVLEWVTPVEWKHIAVHRLIDALLCAAEADDTGEQLAAFLNLQVKPRLPDL